MSETGEKTAKQSELPAIAPKLFYDIQHPKQRRFLAAYASTGGIRAAARLCGVDCRFHYLWLQRDESGSYAQAFDRARQIACDNAEDEIYRRGVNGYPRELHWKGHKTGESVTEYSDTLAMGFLKANREKYRDGNQLAIGPAKISIEIVNTQAPAGDSNEIVLNPPTKLDDANSEETRLKS